MSPKQTTASGTFLAAIALCQLAMTSPTPPDLQQSIQARYEPTWESTDRHNPSPDWFKDAKLGVYWHWGAFATAQFGSEWYPRNLYFSDSEEHAHQVDTYGDPATVFGYQNFIKGGTDLHGNHVEFRPVLKSQGGEFDPEAWIAAIKASGARFAGPVAEHHDGYSLWGSKVNEWNAVLLGPELDLVKMFAQLVRDNGLKLMIAMHTAFNVNGYFSAAPNTTDPSLRKLLGQWDNHEDASDYWLAKQVEALEHVQPDMIWNDFSLWAPGQCDEGYICGIYEPQRLKFLAHYFNRGLDWGKEVLTTYKHTDDGFRNTSAVPDWERGGPAELTRPYWQTDDAISSSSWSYTVGIKYYSAKQMVHSLLDRVSKNGNMLLNVSPTAAGVLPEEQVKILEEIGGYLARHGESVYGTRAWDIYGEGPNRAGGGAFTKPLLGNSSDVRFTRSKDEKVLFATVLGWPEDGIVKIENLGSDRDVNLRDGQLEYVQLLGDESGKYTDIDTATGVQQKADGLVITLPSTRPAESHAYVLKLTFHDRIPVPQPSQGATIWSTYNNTTGKGVTLGLGEFRGPFLTDAGLEGKNIGMIRVSAGSKICVFASPDLKGSGTVFTEGEHEVQIGTVGSISLTAA